MISDLRIFFEENFLHGMTTPLHITVVNYSRIALLFLIAFGADSSLIYKLRSEGFLSDKEKSIKPAKN